jgi:hypothetical protein
MTDRLVVTTRLLTNGSKIRISEEQRPIPVCTFLSQIMWLHAAMDVDIHFLLAASELA